MATFLAQSTRGARAWGPECLAWVHTLHQSKDRFLYPLSLYSCEKSFFELRSSTIRIMKFACGLALPQVCTVASEFFLVTLSACTLGISYPQMWREVVVPLQTTFHILFLNFLHLYLNRLQCHQRPRRQYEQMAGLNDSHETSSLKKPGSGHSLPVDIDCGGLKENGHQRELHY